MKEYIATFYSHFGAMRFRKNMADLGICVRLMPVPRNLSSSCGTCGAFSCSNPPSDDPYGEIEQIVEVTSDGYVPVYKAPNA